MLTGNKEILIDYNRRSRYGFIFIRKKKESINLKIIMKKDFIKFPIFDKFSHL